MALFAKSVMLFLMLLKLLKLSVVFPISAACVNPAAARKTGEKSRADLIGTLVNISGVASPVASGDTRSGLEQIGRLRRDGRRRSGTTGVSGETY